MSAVEGAINIAVGIGVAFGSQLIIFPIVGIHDLPIHANMEITAFMTFVSFVRQYVLRRLFNQLHRLS